MLIQPVASSNWTDEGNLTYTNKLGQGGYSKHLEILNKELLPNKPKFFRLTYEILPNNYDYDSYGINVSALEMAWYWNAGGNGWERSIQENSIGVHVVEGYYGGLDEWGRQGRFAISAHAHVQNKVRVKLIKLEWLTPNNFQYNVIRT